MTLGDILIVDILAIVFYEFSLLLIAGAVGVVVSKSPVKSILCLIMCFFATAFLWMIEEAEFLSLALIFVYVGAVMTLFLFVVMMLNVSKLPPKGNIIKIIPFLLFVMLIFGFGFYKSFVLLGDKVSSVSPSNNNHILLGSAQNIAKVLYTDYAICFEIVAVLLLTSIIAAITLSYRGKVGYNLKQKISKQVTADPKNRVTLVNIATESKHDFTK